MKLFKNSSRADEKLVTWKWTRMYILYTKAQRYQLIRFYIKLNNI